MSIFINDLIPLLARELRDVNLPYQFSDDDLFSALNDGLSLMNLDHIRQYDIVGAGSSSVFSPDPSLDDQKIIVLYGAIQLLSGEKVKASILSLVLSNAAGRTDLTSIPTAIENSLQSLQSRLNRIINELKRFDIESQMSSREKTRQSVS